MDGLLASSLQKKLGVDAVIVISMNRCGPSTGTDLSAAIYSTLDGRELASYNSSAPGMGSWGNRRYMLRANAKGMADDTASALVRTVAQ